MASHEVQYVPWDGQQVLPQGVMEPTRQAVLDEFSESVNRLRMAGFELMATLPVAKPGQSLLMFGRRTD